MRPSSTDIKDILAGRPELGLTFATNLFIGREEPAPDKAVTIYDTPGKPPQLTLTPGENYQYPSIQVRVRSKGYLEAQDLAQQISDILHATAHVELNGIYYSLIRCISGPFFLEWDENTRAKFVINFEIQRRSL